MENILNANEFLEEMSTLYFDRILPIKVTLYFKGEKINWGDASDIPEWIIIATQAMVKQGRIDPNDIVIHEDYIYSDESRCETRSHDITINKDGRLSEPFMSDFQLYGKLLESYS